MQSRKFFATVLFKVFANLRAETSRYYLSYLWWIGEPIMAMAVYYLVFGILLRSGTDNYVSFLLVGVTAWIWFSRSIQNGSGAILASRALIGQIRITKVFFPLVTVVQDFAKHLIVVGLLLGFLILYGQPVTAAWLSLPLILAVQLVLIFGCATAVAAVLPFLPDLRYLINSGLQLMFFGTGIFFDIDEVFIPRHRGIVYLNPVAGLIKNYRTVLLEGDWPDWPYLAGALGFSALLASVAILIVRRLDYVYPRYVL